GAADARSRLISSRPKRGRGLLRSVMMERLAWPSHFAVSWSWRIGQDRATFRASPSRREIIMQRLNPFAIVPDAYKAVSGVESYIRNCGLEKSLIHLVKMRASQISSCAYCLDMHSKEARKDGESEQRLYLLEAWEEVSLYTPRERAALAWTEAVTRIADTRTPDAVYEELRRYFSEAETVNLTTAIGVINLWNRLCVSFRIQPPAEKSAAA